MTLARGIETGVGYGSESSFGVADTINLYTRIISETLQHIKEPFMTESLGGGWRDELYYSAGRNEGDIVVENIYTGHELFWHGLFGTYDHTPNGGATGAHQHVFAFVPSTNNHPSMTIQVDRGIAGTDEMKYLGMYPTKATIEFANRQILRTTFSLIGTGYAQAAPLTSSYPTFVPILPSHKSTLEVDGAALTILSGTIEIEVPRASDREHYGESLYKEPMIVDRPKASFSLECEYNDATGADTQALYDEYLSETELTSGIEITMQGGSVGSGNYGFSIVGSSAYITGDSPSVQGPGIVPITISGEIFTGLTLQLTNGTTPAVA